jgi:Tol biopolymer transport system component
MLKILLRIGIVLTALGTALALTSVGVGRLLPAGERVVITLSGRPYQGAYLLDVEHRLLYSIDPEAGGSYALDPLDNNRVVYDVERDDNWDVYITDLFSGKTQRLTDSPGYDGQAVWSADGEWITYTSEGQFGSVHISALAADGGTPQPLTNGGLYKIQPTWSPDGRRVVYVGSDDSVNISLYMADSACLTTSENCSRRSMQITSAIQGDYLPVWSPDGRWIAFLSDRGGTNDVYIMDTACLDSAAGCIQQNARQLTHGARATSALMWSQDGGKIRFIAESTNKPVFHEITMGCDLLPDGCTLQALVGFGE